jgi:hypothetical protein
MSIMGCFSKDIVGYLVGHSHYDSVITLLPSFLESGAENFKDENLKSIFDSHVLLKLFERWLFLQFIPVVCIVATRYVPSVSVFGNQGLIILK